MLDVAREHSRYWDGSAAVELVRGNALAMPFDGEFPYFHILSPVRAMTATVAAELGEAPVGSDHYQALYVIGLLLFSITFAINLTADLIVKGIRRE